MTKAWEFDLQLKHFEVWGTSSNLSLLISSPQVEQIPKVPF